VSRAEELVGAYDLLEAAVVVAVKDADRDRSWTGCGHTSVIAWLSHRAQVARHTAARFGRQAKFIHKHDQAHAAFDNGDLSPSKLDRLARITRRRERLYERDEATLLDQAATLDVNDFQATTEQWRLYADDLHTPSETGDMRSRLDLTTTFAGCGDLRGQFCPEDHSRLRDTLDRIMGPPAEGDTRDISERRAQALMDMTDDVDPEPAFVDDTQTDEAFDATLPTKRPTRNIDIIVDLSVVAKPDDYDPEHAYISVGSIGPVLRTTLQAMCCDASVGRIVMDGKSQVIDVSRRTRVIPDALRRALNARDRGCGYPGCRRHYTWCDAHHITHWADNGPTNLENLVLLCARHHHYIHQHHIHIDRDPVSGAVELHAHGP
jgi:hypothetical protein